MLYPYPSPAPKPPPPPTSSRRSLAAALLLGAVGATVVLLASGQIWAEGTAAVGGGSLPLDAEGSDVTGVPTALAIVGLAALVAVFAVRSAGRLLVSALLALSGAGAALAAFLGASDSAALDEKAAQDHRRHGRHGRRAHPHRLALRDRGRRPADPARGPARAAVRQAVARHVGPVRARRHPAAPQGRRSVDPDRPEDLWKALDRGEDPTREGVTTPASRTLPRRTGQ